MASGQLPLGPLDTAAIVGESEESAGFPFQRIRQFKLTAKSEPKTIDVKPLPAGAPAGFDGAVGEFSIAAAFDPPPVRADDPVAIRLTVTGTGDPAQVKAPRLSGAKEWESFEGSREETATDSVVAVVPCHIPPNPPSQGRATGVRAALHAGLFQPAHRSLRDRLQRAAAPAGRTGSGHRGSRARNRPPPRRTEPRQCPPSPRRRPWRSAPANCCSTSPPPPRRAGPATAHGSPPVLWSIHALGLLAVLGVWLARWHRNWQSSDAGRLAACRRDFRRRLQSLGSHAGDEATLLAAVRWLDDWQKSPFARPLSEREEKIAALLRDALAATRYAPSRFATVSEATSLPNLLAPLLKPQA